MSPFHRRQKIAAGSAMSAVAVMAVVGGTLAQFTDSDTTAPQVLTAGTVAVDLVEGSNWTDNLNNLAVGDTADRAVTVDNTSTLDISAMRLTADVSDTVGEFGGALSEAVMVDITQDGTTVLANDVRLADLAAGYDLTFAAGNLPANTDAPLLFHYEVAGARLAETGNRGEGQRETIDNPDNKYQGASLAVTYTIDAVQRPGQDVDGAAVPSQFPLSAPAPLVASSVYSWGSNNGGETVPPVGLTDAVSVSAGNLHQVAVKADGTVVGWGNNTYGQATAPAGLTGVIAVSAGHSHTLALKSDGTVVAWGRNNLGQTNIPAGLSGVVAVSAGAYHNLALKADGSVVAWGYNNNGSTVVPAGLTEVVAISAGFYHSVALKADGTVVAWGQNAYGQTTIPAGLVGVTAISAGNYHTVALKADGTVAVWGDNANTQLNMPAGLTGVTAIDAGANHTLALKADGTVAAWGFNGSGQATVPGGLNNVVAVSAGSAHNVVMVAP